MRFLMLIMIMGMLLLSGCSQFDKGGQAYDIPVEIFSTLNKYNIFDRNANNDGEYYSVEKKENKKMPGNKITNNQTGERANLDLLILVNKDNPLPDEFVPEHLVEPNVLFTFEEKVEKRLMNKTAARALEKMFQRAESEGLKLYAASGYRSYKTQEQIFNYNKNTYGEREANRFSAYPGESEHQTGLAMDITCESIGFTLSQQFGDTPEGKWLQKHAAEFGFIIRYPQGKEDITGYMYEPWHVRYVGHEVANIIMKNNITLEEYITE